MARKLVTCLDLRVEPNRGGSGESADSIRCKKLTADVMAPPSAVGA